MKLAALLLLFASLPALADSVPPPTLSFSMTGIGSGINETTSPYELWSGDSAKGFRYGLTVWSSIKGSSDFSGSFYATLGNVHLNGGLPDATFANGILTGTFSGIEFIRVGPENWIYYDVTGALREGVNFSSPTGTGSINLSSAVFEGKYYVAPEPSTWILFAAGLGLIAWRYCKTPPLNKTV